MSPQRHQHTRAFLIALIVLLSSASIPAASAASLNSRCARPQRQIVHVYQANESADKTQTQTESHTGTTTPSPSAQANSSSLPPTLPANPVLTGSQLSPFQPAPLPVFNSTTNNTGGAAPKTPFPHFFEAAQTAHEHQIRQSQHEPVPFAVSLQGGIDAYGTLAAADSARVEAFYSAFAPAPEDGLVKRAASIQASNTGVTYTTTVGIGNPATNYTLLIDSGSSNTWVGAKSAYVQTRSSTKTNYAVSVGYASGSFTGTEYYDRVAISSSLVINNQSIGVTTKNNTKGFANVDGILGVGPVDLTYASLTSSSSSPAPAYVPTVLDNLASQKTISSNVLGVSYLPITAYPTSTGELTFGGVDTAKYNGSINYVNLTQTWPASAYWGINQTLKYGNTQLLSNGAGIVDTGTTLTLLASDIFAKYRTLTNATPDTSTGLLRITPASYALLQPLVFTIGKQSYSMTPNAQIWPRALNAAIGGNSSYIYLIIGNLGRASGQGLDFVNGYTFLERFYAVFDGTNQRFGIAQTNFTNSTTN